MTLPKDDPGGREPRRALEGFFRDQRRLSLAEAPSFDELAAYVEGRLDAEARVRLEERMEADPVLRQEMEDLRALHVQMARPRHLAARPLRARLVTVAAAAAVVAVALAVWRRPGVEVAPPSGTLASPSPAPVATLRDGDARLSLSADGTLGGLASLDPKTRGAVAAALRGTLPAPPADVVRPVGGGAVLGQEPGPPPFGPTSPLGTRVLSDRPTLRWTPLPGARSYEVTVLDGDLRMQASSGALTATQWTLPKPLPRGRTYLWQVSTLVGGQRLTAPAPPAPEARFEVADATVEAEVQRRRAEAPGSHVVAAVALVEAGLFDEAEAELAALAADNPGSPEVARLRAAVGALRQAPQGR
jgi:hypothetical protein